MSTAVGFLSRFSADAQSLAEKFHIDSLFPSVVSDTLNVEALQMTQWISSESGERGSNALLDLQNYHPLHARSFLRNDLGNIGSAEHTVVFGLDRRFGFQFRSGRSAFWVPLSSRRILLSEQTFSNVQYSNGANRENFLTANLTRGFGQLVNLGFNFTRINSLGFYDRQQNIITDMFVFGTVRSKDDRYKAVVAFSYSNLLMEENGGIANDTVFEENITPGRSFMAVNLTGSSNHWKGFEVGLEQRFLLLKPDTLRNGKSYIPAIRHSFSVFRNSMVYEGSASDVSYYENIYSDSTATYDSTNLLGVSNRVSIELLKDAGARISALERLSVGIGHEYIRVSYDSSFTQSLNNLSVHTAMNGRLFNSLAWKANGSLMFYGYNIWDLKVDGVFDYTLKQSRFSAFIDYSLYRPDYITDNYRSNHFVWDNSWVQTQHLKTGLMYTQKRLRFKGTFSYHLLDNLVMFGADKLPYQSTAVNQLMVLKLEEHFRLRWFHLIVNGALQWRMTGDDIRVPLTTGRGMFYYQNDIFKRKLRLQVGAQVSFALSYLANAYNPALSEFYIQNDRQIGNYPFIDVFLNLRVKKLRMFVKFSHINSGWLGYTYYHVPHYPVNDFAWHFGINWAFLD